MSTTIAVSSRGWLQTVECDEGDLVKVTYQGELRTGVIERVSSQGVTVGISLYEGGFYDFADIEPLTDEELDEYDADS